MIILKPERLTREAFAPFGDIIDTAGANHYPINQGTAERFHDLATVDTGEAGGRTLISIFRGHPRTMPFALRVMERHPLGSQAFIPLTPRPYLVVVAPPGGPPAPGALRAFLATAGQGVNYHRGVWHHPLIVIDDESDFVVIDRGGPGENCEEHTLAEAETVMLHR